MGMLRDLLNRILTTMAWWLSDWMGWRAALSVYPPLLANKVAIVSGANAGLGLETTKALLQQGATVVMACRSLEHAHTAREDILRDRRNHGAISNAAARLIPLHLDLEDCRTIRRFADDFHALQLRGLHVLVNNAGVHLKEHKHVAGDIERTLASDYYGHFYLTHLLMPDLQASAPSRVINVASVAEMLGPVLYTHTLPWDDLRGRQLPDSGERPYTIAKTMLLMANTRELARRTEGSGVDVIAVHPGISDSTWYLKSDNEAYMFSWVISRVRAVIPWLGVGQPVAMGAISTIYAAMAPELTGITSSPRSRGIVDALARALFGGRLIYLGPSYLSNVFIANLFNTGRRWAVNPWCYNRRACARLYDATLDLLGEIEKELGLTPALGRGAQQQALGVGSASVAAGVQQQEGGISSNGVSSSSGGDSTYGGSVGGLKQRPVAGAPAGEDLLTLSAAAQPLRGV